MPEFLFLKNPQIDLPTQSMKVCFSRFFVLASCLAIFVFVRVVSGADWKDIDPTEFQLTESAIDPGFGAEILFSETNYSQVHDSSTGLLEEIKHYMRFRVYNELGVSQLAGWKLTYDDDEGGIRGIRGRTVKPSGEVYELQKEHIFDTELVRTGQVDVAAKSFAFPNVEPGDIVELQYSLRNDEINWIPTLRFQERLPARRISKRIRPFEYPGIGHMVARFNFPEADLSKRKFGFYELEKTNVRAMLDEPYSLPDNSIIPSIVLYYFPTDERPSKNADFWKFKAKKLHSEGKKALSTSKQIVALAEELVEGKASDWEKLEALYDYCQEEVLNIRYSRGRLTKREISKIKESNKPQATLERGNGRPNEVTFLFGALAKAVGFEPRITAMHDNRDVVFKGWMVLDFVLGLRYVAIDFDDQTHYFRPGNPFLYCGEVEWFAANCVALEATPKNGELEFVKQKGADHSVTKRSLTGSIDDEGTLTGKVEIELSGYSGWDLKQRFAMMDGREEREEFLEDQIKRQMPQARLKNIVIKRRSSHKSPIAVTYDLEIPDYADVTRKRLYFQPFVFGKGAQDLFVKEERISDMQFNYASRSEDSISIQIPEGYALEEGAAPARLELGKFGEYKIGIRATKSGKIMYDRTFTRNIPSVPAKAYAAVKNIYHEVNLRDQHALGFKRVESDL